MRDHEHSFMTSEADCSEITKKIAYKYQAMQRCSPITLTLTKNNTAAKTEQKLRKDSLSFVDGSTNRNKCTSQFYPKICQIPFEVTYKQFCQILHSVKRFYLTHSTNRKIFDRSPLQIATTISNCNCWPKPKVITYSVVILRSLHKL